MKGKQNIRKRKKSDTKKQTKERKEENKNK
jgi:hypothetical protein